MTRRSHVVPGRVDDASWAGLCVLAMLEEDLHAHGDSEDCWLVLVPIGVLIVTLALGRRTPGWFVLTIHQDGPG